jgi:hypothetical protein
MTVMSHRDLFGTDAKIEKTDWSTITEEDE